MDTTIVFSGGPVPTPIERSTLSRRIDGVDVARVVAADSGILLADALGMTLVAGRDLLLGDMDSIGAARLAEAEDAGVTVERFPTDKDATDLELALDDAVAHATPGDHLVVVGTTAGRFDHVLSMLSTVSAQRYERVVRDVWLGADVVHVVDAGIGSPRSLLLPTGATFSLLATQGPAIGVTVEHARWALHGETLEVGTSRGISNESTGEAVTVACERGTLLVVVPGTIESGDAR